MVNIRIAGEERRLADTDEQWVNQRINRRQTDGQVVCVTVEIEESDLYMVLATSACGSRGGGREPTERERRVFDLWRKLGLDDAHFTGGRVVAFLKQLEKLLH